MSLNDSKMYFSAKYKYPNFAGAEEVCGTSIMLIEPYGEYIIINITLPVEFDDKYYEKNARQGLFNMGAFTENEWNPVKDPMPIHFDPHRAIDISTLKISEGIPEGFEV